MRNTETTTATYFNQKNRQKNYRNLNESRVTKKIGGISRDDSSRNPNKSWLCTFTLNTNPKFRAALTRAPSSGD